MIKNFKIFEEYTVSSKKVLGTNESFWQYNDDADRVTAYILLDEDDSLYLEIKKVHIKSGIGAGTRSTLLESVSIGTLQKPNLTSVRSLLKKHAHQRSSAGRGFSTFWEDEEGNKMNLTDLINLNKPEKPMKKLKHIKSSSDFKKTEEVKKDIELVKYSDRSYALFGEGTKDIKDELIKLNCRYNKFLTDPKTGKKRAGWICAIGKVDKVKELL